jgi:hypothetical protein
LPISVHQWQDYYLKYYLNGVSALEAFQKFGMDAQIQYFGDTAQTMMSEYDSNTYSTPEWREEVKVISNNPDDHIEYHIIQKHRGILTHKPRGDRKTPWITEYIIKQDEDIELLHVGLVDLQHPLEESIGNRFVQRPLAVLAEHRVIPHLLIHLHSHEPAEQQVIVQLLHQQALASYRMEYLQQQRAQQPFGRNRRSPTFAYRRAKRGDISFNTVSTISRIGRKRCSLGTRFSGEI